MNETTQTSSGGFTGFFTDLANIYRDVKVAETNAELAAYQFGTQGATGAEAVVDSEAANTRDLSGQIVTGAQNLVGNLPPVVLYAGAALAVIGLGYALKKAF